MKPEKAILVESLQQLHETKLEAYSRLYFGNETCDRCIPSLAELREAKSTAKKHSMAFSLVTPFCTNDGLKNLIPLLSALSGEDELIINDFGVLHLAPEHSAAEPVAGRLLNRQYRDPRIASFKQAPEAMCKHLSSSHSSSHLFQGLLQNHGIKRVGLDNLLQGIGTDLSGTSLNASLYFPLVFIAATRFCLLANCDSLAHAKKVGVLQCGKECLRYSFSLKNKAFSQPLLLKGNALYFENHSIPKNLSSKGIDRLVFTARKNY